MKRLIVFATFISLAVACGKVDVANEDDSGVGRYINGSVTDADSQQLTQMTNICQVLKDKELVFRTTYLGSSSKFNFQTAQTNCDKKRVTSAVQARLSYAGNALQYERLLGDYFVSQVETGYTGVISPLCQNLSSLKWPQPVGTEIMLRYFVRTGADCSDNGTFSCLTIQTAFKQDDDRFLITKTDEFKIDLAAGPLSGMVKEHEHRNGDLCSDGESLINKATFTGITN